VHAFCVIFLAWPWLWPHALTASLISIDLYANSTHCQLSITIHLRCLTSLDKHESDIELVRFFGGVISP